MSPEPLFVPTVEAVAASQLTAFTRSLEEASATPLPDWPALHRFSVEEHRRFWAHLLAWSGLLVEGSPEPACVGDEVEHARFFPGLALSFTENLLAGDDDLPAIIAAGEGGERRLWSRGELRARVLALAAGLVRLGIAPGDRVVAVARNTADVVAACLAAAAVGAIWSAVATDLGLEATLDRFRPLEPVLLFAHGRHRHHGAERPLHDRLAAIAAALPSLRAIVPLGDDELPGLEPQVPVAELLTAPPLGTLPRLPFDHPLFILFSSGTTGAPKCIVHGAGGTLLEHVKEHRLHCDLRPGDRLFYQTTCGWMMWNWLITALASRAAIVLWDGSVSFPDEDALWRLAATERVTHFGTSPAYLQYCRDAEISPRERFDLSALRAVMSTGSILPEPLFHWAREHLGAVPLQSISGGTDIVGCFVLGQPNLPVWPGEIQSVSLGLDVRAHAPDARGVGELVCARPFPSRPVGFWGDPDGRRFHDAYFAQHPGLWTHGDFLELTPHHGARIHGRSDGVINVRGIRVGPAEIYAALTALPEIVEAMAVEQPAPREPGGSRLVLLVVLREGRTLDRPLTLRIKKTLAERCSMAHVPAAVAAVAELPATFSGKRSERAARDALADVPVRNLAALRNPDCLEAIRHHPALGLD